MHLRGSVWKIFECKRRFIVHSDSQSWRLSFRPGNCNYFLSVRSDWGLFINSFLRCNPPIWQASACVLTKRNATPPFPGRPVYGSSAMGRIEHYNVITANATLSGKPGKIYVKAGVAGNTRLLCWRKC